MKKTYITSSTLFAVLIIIAVVTFVNCNKASTASNFSVNNSSTTSPSTYAGPCPYECHDPRCKVYQTGYCGPETISIITNPNNPYDYAGSQHNSGVTYILNALGGPSTNDSLILNADINYMQALGFTAAQCDSLYNLGVSFGYLPFSQIPELDSLGNLMYSQGQISSIDNSYIQQIFNIANQYLQVSVDTADYSTDSTNYIAFANSLISLESAINNNSNLTSTEKAGFLSACSIGRYSASYWANYQLNGSGSGGVAKFHFWKWLKVVVCDVAGAIVGIASQFQKWRIPGEIASATGASVAAM